MLADVLDHLDCQYPGLHFRIITEHDTIRLHVKIYVNETQAMQLC